MANKKSFDIFRRISSAYSLVMTGFTAVVSWVLRIVVTSAITGTAKLAVRLERTISIVSGMVGRTGAIVKPTPTITMGGAMSRLPDQIQRVVQTAGNYLVFLPLILIGPSIRNTIVMTIIMGVDNLITEALRRLGYWDAYSLGALDITTVHTMDYV